MTEKTWDRIRKIQLFLFIVVTVMLLSGGCGTQGEGDAAASPDDMATAMSGGVNISALGTSEWTESQAADKTEGADTEEVPGMDANPNTSEIIYQGTNFMSSYRCIGGDSIYSTGFLGEFDGNHPAEGPYFAGRIGIEENDIQQFALEIPEDMFAVRGCVDRQGRWHLLLAQKTENPGTDGKVEIPEDRKVEIWVIDRDGNLEQSMDVTESFGGGRPLPLWMEVDHETNYYFASGQTIMILNTSEQSVEVLNFGGSIAGIGIGRSGALYGVFDAGEGDFLGLVDTDSGSIEKCAAFPENDARPSFSALQGGVSVELLLANMEDGVWSYDGEGLKQTVTLDNMVVNGQDILAMGFLWDSRVCIMSREDGKYIFHYAPAEL